MSDNRKLKFWKMANEGVGFELKRKLIYPEDYFSNMPYTYSDSELETALNDL